MNDRFSIALRRTRRAMLNHFVLNGVQVAIGLLLISTLVHIFLGAVAAATATVGVIAASPPDQPAPKRGKLWRMAPALIITIPLFWVMHVLHPHPFVFGVALVLSTFVAFLGMAWGKRGVPIAMSAVLAVIFVMAAPLTLEGDPIVAGLSPVMSSALLSTLYFSLGSVLYQIYAVITNSLLNGRYREQFVADALLTLSALTREQAAQFTPRPQNGQATAAPLNATPGLDATGEEQEPNEPPELGRLLSLHASFADQLQAARDIVLESPTTARRQRLAGMLMQLLEIRDHLLACELDLDALRPLPQHAGDLVLPRQVLLHLTREMAQLADALLLHRKPAPFVDMGHALPPITQDDLSHAHTPDALSNEWMAVFIVQGLMQRIRRIHDEVRRLVALGRDEAEPDLAVVRASWQMFVSPVTWSWAPLKSVMNWDAPGMRHALRAAMAVAVGFYISRFLPWSGHAYWLVLTIVVVLRGSLSQTVDRRNNRVIGTLIGCVITLLLLSAKLPFFALTLCMTVALAFAHGFALRRYMVAAIGATVLGLMQAHMLHANLSPAVAMMERVLDTLLGAGLAWVFSYVLPSWERGQIPALIKRTLAAQAQHARSSLSLAQLQAVDNTPELEWRLARREAYDSLSALVQATERAVKEPRAVRPPLLLLQHLQAHCYQLLGQLTAVKTLLMLRRGNQPSAWMQSQLALTAEHIGNSLQPRPVVVDPVEPTGQESAQNNEAVTTAPAGPAGFAEAANNPVHTPGKPLPTLVMMPESDHNETSTWLIRRLHTAADLADLLGRDARQVHAALEQALIDKEAEIAAQAAAKTGEAEAASSHQTRFTSGGAAMPGERIDPVATREALVAASSVASASLAEGSVTSAVDQAGTLPGGSASRGGNRPIDPR